jgi:glycerophosphoryl diester phosphodiesterase
VRRRGRKIAISEVTHADLPSHIPTVAEMLTEVPGDFDFSLDVKDPAALSATLDSVRLVKPELEPRLWLCHHNWQVVATWRSMTEAKLVDSTRLSRLKDGPERRAAQLHEAGIDCINMHHTDWNGGLVTLFHRFNRFALGWDMQQDHVLDDGIRMGLDGVFSDYTDRMLDAFARNV